MKILLVVYDNDSFVHWFPQGLAYIAAVLRLEGHEVEIYNQDKSHAPDKALTKYLNNNDFDVIGVSVIAGYYQYQKLLKISEAINKSRKRPYYLLGGHGPAPEPEYFLKITGADVVVIGEGEVTISELMEAIAGKKALKSVKGIAFMDGDKVKITPRRTLIKDIDTIPLPAYDLFPMDYYRLLRMPRTVNTDFVMPVLSGRGCTFRCNFCYRMDKGFRPRSTEAIVDEIRFLKRNYGITYITFSDELLMSSVERTEELCKGMIKARLNVRWCCNGRLNYAKPDLLKLMKKSGCVFINYGIEAMDDQVLKSMKKGLTCKQIIKGIEATKKEGIAPGYNIIFGHIGDTKETLQKGVDFLLKYDDELSQMRTIRPVTPYPGSPLYYHAIEKGLLKDVKDFYENKHTNSDLVAINFTDMTNKEFHRCLMKANITLIENYYKNLKASTVDQTRKLYLKENASFRGFRTS